MEGQLLLSKLFPPTHQPELLRVNQCAVTLFNHLPYTWLPMASILNQSVKVATISDIRSLFHFPTLSYPDTDPGQLTSQGSTRLVACEIRSHLALQLQLRIFMVSEVYLARGSTWQLHLTQRIFREQRFSVIKQHPENNLVWTESRRDVKVTHIPLKHTSNLVGGGDLRREVANEFSLKFVRQAKTPPVFK